jgi:hypothetical protein
VRRPALMRQFKIGRDGLRRVLRALIRLGWIRAEVARSAETGRVYVTYEVRDEPGPELSEDDARKALSLESGGAAGEASDDEGAGAGTEDDSGEAAGAPPAGADPPDDRPTGGDRPPTGSPEAARRLRLSPPGPIEESLKTDSEKPESPNGVRAFAEVASRWPVDHVLSRVTAEAAFVALSRKDQADCDAGIRPYLADCSVSNRKVCDLSTFIRERRWERFAAKAQAASRHAVFKIYSPNWYRWREYKIAVGQPVKFMESYARNNPQGQWSEAGEWPPPLPAKDSGPTAPGNDPQFSPEDAQAMMK